MIYFHCSDLHVTPCQRDRKLLFAGWLGFGEGMFLFLPFAFFDSGQWDGNNLFDVKNDDARI